MAELIELSANENLLGPSPKAIEAIRGTLDDLHFYPRAHDVALAEKLDA